MQKSRKQQIEIQRSHLYTGGWITSEQNEIIKEGLQEGLDPQGLSWWNEAIRRKQIGKGELWDYIQYNSFSFFLLSKSLNSFGFI